MLKSKNKIDQHTWLTWLIADYLPFIGVGMFVVLALCLAVTTSASADLEDEILKKIPKLNIPGLELPKQLQGGKCKQRSLDVPVCTQELYVGSSPAASVQSLKVFTKPAHSFSTVKDALDSHTDQSCAANIILSEPRHSETIDIDRDASISSPSGVATILNGSIRIKGPYAVKVRGLNVVGARPTKQNQSGDQVVAGAIDIDNECAAVTIAATTIRDMEGFSIRQRGGKLAMTFVTIERTRRSPRDGRAAAIDLSGGVSAELTGVGLRSNEARGLFIHGQNTGVTGTGIEIHDTYVRNSWFNTCLADSQILTGYGAVEVGANANATLSGNMLNNSFISLHAHSGASISWQRGKIVNNTGFEMPGCVYGINPEMRVKEVGGFGAYAESGGRIDLRNFEIAHSELCGLYVDDDGNGSANYGTFRENFTAVCIQNDNFDYSNIGDDVSLIDNTRNLDANTPPVPELPLDL